MMHRNGLRFGDAASGTRPKKIYPAKWESYEGTARSWTAADATPIGYSLVN